jgi:3'-phosphoadenosine 5'-phosphosulfate sulfotransferase (PAPS reductase)/FAD synthetase
MSKDAFRLPEPCIVGCSGGRTSGYLLRRVLDAYDGVLPPSIRIVFANTGKERERSLIFVERQSIEWGVEVTWVEYRDRYPDHGYEVVNFDTASRRSEPFNQMLEWKARYRSEVKDKPPVLPNPAQRMCTGDLKTKTMSRFAKDIWGVTPSQFNVALALRHDEQLRIQRAEDRGNEAGVPCYPLDEAEVVAEDVVAFWKSQPFDLGLKSYQGNCDLCFMKSRPRMERLLAEEPQRAEWWIEQERWTGQKFRRDRASYAGMLWQIQNQTTFDFPEVPDVESVISCESGYCSD